MKLSVFVPCFFIIHATSSISGNSGDIALSETDEKLIIGGENARDAQAPFMCSLQKNENHICGCAILSPKFVATAAHCVFGSLARELRILAGTNNLKGNGDYYSAVQITKHERYSIVAYGYDIAVVEVNGPISFNDKVGPITISSEEPPHGALAQLTGWGRLYAPNRSYPDQLQLINLPVVSTERCRQKLGSVVHDSHICTFAGAGQGACYADSGSPLVLNNELIGIVNFGRPCALGYPDAYAKVSYLADWIRSKAGL